MLLYRKSTNIKEFVKKNWLDIISVIPFGMAFKLTKLVRGIRLLKLFTRTAKVSKLTKVTKVSKISKAMRLKSQIPRTGKILSKFKKKEE
jgi:hypothetical protein